MSGPESSSRGLPVVVREAMVRFNVEEKEARQMLVCSSVLAAETVAKWKRNVRRAQMHKATEILELIEKAQSGDARALEEAKTKLEAVCKVASWEVQP